MDFSNVSGHIIYQQTPDRSAAPALEQAHNSRLILGLRPANERRCYKVTPSPID